ncbi:MAG: 4-hydroxy-tetrahydrodipicolinate reductase [Pirellulaceae bacterium]|nr:4-hydroxy-tetrahydrodipicolinate reductase [Pirellulaceae bacterium]
MGRRLIALGHADSQLQIVGAVDSSKNPLIGSDAGQAAGVGTIGLTLTEQWPDRADVAIDFSVPAACLQAVQLCQERSIALVAATTGLEPHQVDVIRAASNFIPICWAPNMSLAVNLTMRLAQQAATALKAQQPDVEILERHHRFKEDSPSGTALKFGELIANAMGLTSHVHGREGQCGPRTRNEIGYHAIRTGDDPGQHTIIFGMLGETIELRVAASNRDCYAQGALAAAKFLVGKPPGLYSMFDVLGLPPH